MKPRKDSVFQFLLFFLLQKWQRVLFVVLAMVVWPVVDVLMPYYLKCLIDDLVGYKGDMKQIWAIASPFLIILSCLLFTLELAFRAQEYVKLYLLPDIKANIRAYMFDYCQKHSYGFFQDELAGNISNKILDMVRAFENLFIIIINIFFPISLLTILTISFLWVIHWSFGLFVLGWFVIYLLVTLFMSKRCINASGSHSTANSNLSGKLVDVFRNIASVKLFARRTFENSYFRVFQNDEIKKSVQLGKYLFEIHIFQGIASFVFFIFSLILFISAWEKGIVSVGDFTFIMSTTMQLVMMTWWMAEQFVTVFKEIGVAKQAMQVINQGHGIVDLPHAMDLTVLKGRIEFDRVSFHYLQGKNVFLDKSLIIEAGQRVGLVGFSGSGKTTFVNLIQRAFDLKSGRILIDDNDISQVKQESLRENIAFIPQDTSLFHRTLLENIRYGKLEATDEEVIQASKDAFCHEYIIDLEDQYDSLVGEGGVKLSGGQRQRIAIARAILKNAPILVLDEATSALDSVTESKIQKSLQGLMQGRTTIVIAHRLSTLKKLDKIFVFDKGKIVESGNHQELLDEKGHYFHLWKLQHDGFIPD